MVIQVLQELFVAYYKKSHYLLALMRFFSELIARQWFEIKNSETSVKSREPTVRQRHHFQSEKFVVNITKMTSLIGFRKYQLVKITLFFQCVMEIIHF